MSSQCEQKSCRVGGVECLRSRGREAFMWCGGVVVWPTHEHDRLLIGPARRCILVTGQPDFPLSRPLIPVGRKRPLGPTHPFNVSRFPGSSLVPL